MNWEKNSGMNSNNLKQVSDTGHIAVRAGGAGLKRELEGKGFLEKSQSNNQCMRTAPNQCYFSIISIVFITSIVK